MTANYARKRLTERAPDRVKAHLDGLGLRDQVVCPLVVAPVANLVVAGGPSCARSDGSAWSSSASKARIWTP